MPTLDNFNGASLVPDFIGSAEKGQELYKNQFLLGQAQAQAQRDTLARSQLLGYAQNPYDANAQQQARLAAVNSPEITNGSLGAQGLVQSQQLQRLSMQAAQTEKSAQDALSLPFGEQRNAYLDQLAAQAPDQQHQQAIAAIKNLPDQNASDQALTNVMKQANAQKLSYLPADKAAEIQMNQAKAGYYGALEKKDQTTSLPSGYQSDPNHPGSLMPIPGGPADKTNAPEKPPAGYIADPNHPGSLTFIPGGPADPSIKANAPLGSREATFLNRTLNAANESIADLKNIVKIPLTTSTGIFGGRQQGPSLFAAGKEALANEMTSQEVQSYNTLSSGFQRNLAAIEAAGLAPTGSLTNQMSSLQFKAGDTNFTKLQKLAQTRQIVEVGLQTVLDNPRVPDAQKKSVAKQLANLQDTIPFTGSDLIALQQKQEINPNTTIADIVKSNKTTSTDNSNIYTSPAGITIKRLN